MAIGATTMSGSGGRSAKVELLASVTAANGAPSGGSAGLATSTLSALNAKWHERAKIAVASTAGSGTMTVTLRLWLYTGGTWFAHQPLNASATAPHTAVAVPETGTDAIAYSEDVPGLAMAERLFLEVVAIAGTSTAVTGYVLVEA